MREETTCDNRLAGTLYTVNAIHMYMPDTFLQGHSHTGRTLAPWQHRPVLKVSLGSSSRSRLKFLRTRHVVDLIFPYITVYFKLTIDYVTEVKLLHVVSCWRFRSSILRIKYQCPCSCHDDIWGSSVTPAPLTSAPRGWSAKDQIYNRSDISIYSVVSKISA
jgi:hypothetical protein